MHARVPSLVQFNSDTSENSSTNVFLCNTALARELTVAMKVTWHKSMTWRDEGDIAQINDMEAAIGQSLTWSTLLLDPVNFDH